MILEHAGDRPLDYFPCRYGRSRLVFRGPRRDLAQPYVAFLGGTETYGKYVPEPFPALVESALGVASVNLGCIQAGPDVYLNDPAALELARQGVATVVQVTGALNLSNRLYAVHPRRNDRFLRASPALQALYREVDFTEFAFTRHMIQTLARVSPDKFRIVAEELRTAWLARMILLLERLTGPVVLLWVGSAPPAMDDQDCGLAEMPLVHRGMLAALRPRVSDYVQVVISATAQAEGAVGMVFPVLEEHAAQGLPGLAAHRETAVAVSAALRGLI